MNECRCKAIRDNDLTISECESILKGIEDGTFDAKDYFTKKRDKMTAALEAAKEEERLRRIVNKLVDDRLAEVTFEDDEEDEEEERDVNRMVPLTPEEAKDFLRSILNH